MIDAFQLPTPPPQPADNSYRAFVQWILGYGDKIYTYVNSWTGRLSKQFNTLFTGYGPDIASAATITVANAVHQVTGSTSIATINQPAGQSAVSAVTLYAKDGFTLAAGGNIAVPAFGSGARPLIVEAGSSVTLEYHPSLKKWLVPALGWGSPFTQLFNLTTSGNSPFTIPGQAAVMLVVNCDTGNLIANMSATPSVGDTITAKRTSVSNSIVLTPAAGQTIDGGSTLSIPSGAFSTAGSIVYTGVNKWVSYSSA